MIRFEKAQARRESPNSTRRVRQALSSLGQPRKPDQSLARDAQARKAAERYYPAGDRKFRRKRKQPTGLNLRLNLRRRRIGRREAVMGDFALQLTA